MTARNLEREKGKSKRKTRRVLRVNGVGEGVRHLGSNRSQGEDLGDRFRREKREQERGGWVLSKKQKENWEESRES